MRKSVQLVLVLLAALWSAAGEQRAFAQTALAVDSRTALIVIDLQDNILARQTIHPVDGIVRNAVALARGFKAAGLPVIVVLNRGRPPGRTVRSHLGEPAPAGLASLVPPDAVDHAIEKRSWSAFTNTDLGSFLKRRQISEVVIVGFAASIGVEATARESYDHGLNVLIIPDAVTDVSAEAFDNDIQRIFPRLGVLASTRELLDILAARRGR